MTFAEFQIDAPLHALRSAANITQGQLANLVGTNQSVISRLERGQSLATLPMARKISEALQVPLSRLIAG